MNKTSKCPLCGETENLTGKGKYREDIEEFEWYESDHKCKKITEASKALGQLGGLMTKNRYGKKHFSEAGKRGAEKRWGNNRKM